MIIDISAFQLLPLGLPDPAKPLHLVIVGELQRQITINPDVETILPPPEPVPFMLTVPVNAASLSPITGLPPCDAGVRITTPVTLAHDGDALFFRDIGLSDGDVRIISNLRWPASVGGGIDTLVLSGPALEFVIQGINHISDT